MKIIYAIALLASFGLSAQAEELSAVCGDQAGEYAFSKYADDDFDYVESISDVAALEAVEQNNTDLSDEDITWFKSLVDSREYEYYEVSAGGIGDFIHILIYKKNDCSYVNTLSVFEE